ncbi:MAG: hypothetical protein AB8F95_22390, partial [Bacteroidia bacterium]
MRGSLFFLTLLMLWAGCSSSKQDTFSRRGIQGALLASRFESFEDFKSVVEVSYSEEEGASVVRLHHCANGAEVVSILKSGLSQKDISNAQRGTFADRLHILFRSPYTISSRLELNEINLLAKRRTIFFGEGDVAFFDLALVTVDHINTKALAYKTARDSSEKGYLNTFNHFIAQAIITSCYSERLADFVADVHELKSMPELTHGGFSEDQLVDPNNNPVDN